MSSVMSSTEEKIVQVTPRNYYGMGFPPLIKVWAKNLIYLCPNSEKRYLLEDNAYLIVQIPQALSKDAGIIQEISPNLRPIILVMQELQSLTSDLWQVVPNMHWAKKY